MATVVVHAGMPKNGSTSIQSWLKQESVSLRSEHGIHVVVDQKNDHGSVELAPSDGTRNVMSNRFALTYFHAMKNAPSEREALAGDLIATIEETIAPHSVLVLSGELFAGILSSGDAPLLVALNSLTARHSIRVAYYVSPQHRAIESRWRAWGYKTPLEPGEWAETQREDISYLQTAANVALLAPDISFEVRPFIPDALLGGSPASDFARHFLGVDAPESAVFHRHKGLPLDATNLLRALPRSVTLSPGADREGAMESGARAARLAELFQSWEIPDSTAVERSREVLHHYAHEVFEPDNRELAQQQGWEIDGLIPSPPPTEPGTLADLSDLWSSSATPTELAYLARALTDLVENETVENETDGHPEG